MKPNHTYTLREETEIEIQTEMYLTVPQNNQQLCFH